MTHAFDQDGIMYNHGGFFENIYNTNVINKINENANCTEKQYLSFIKEKFNIAISQVKENVIDEIISDIGALQISEIAFEKWQRQNEFDIENSPGLEGFTPAQLFYMGYAFPYCGIKNVYYNEEDIYQLTHPLYEFRVNGLLFNSAKFSQAWNCHGVIPMNPEKKCKVW